jgi:Breast carcinoma amplified sequence 2 (BCAS2)
MAEDAPPVDSLGAESKALVTLQGAALFRQPQPSHLQTTAHGPVTPMLRDFQPDSLPYLDDDAELAAARPDIEQMIAAEAASGPRQPQAYLSMLPPEPDVASQLSRLFAERSERADAEDAADEASQLWAALPRAPSGRSAADVNAWHDALRKTDALLEHATTALLNIQLLTRYGGSVWKLANRDLDTRLRGVRAEGKAVKEATLQLNRQRKAEQLRVGRPIGKARREYSRLLGKSQAIAAALHRLSS